MRRSTRKQLIERLIEIVPIKLFVSTFACTSVRCGIALISIALIAGCGNNGSGTADGGSSIVVVKPNGAPDSSPSANIQDESTTTPPITDEPGSNQEVSPIVVGGLPHDCIFDVSQRSETFCYQSKTRLLSAWKSDGLKWWSYVLPRDNATNDVHALQIVNGNLYIVAELKNNGLQTGFEVSVFALNGTFKKTVALNKFQDYSFIAGQRIQVAAIDDNLILAGDYGLSTTNILPNQFNGTFVAVFNTTSDQIEKSILYPQSRQTNPIQISGETIKLELEHLVYEVSPSDLELSEPVDRFQSIPFNRSNYHQKKHSVIGFIEKPPFEELYAQMNKAFMEALLEKRQFEPDAPLDEPVDCAGGGTVQQTFVIEDFASEVQTITFENCSLAEFSADGVLLQSQTRTCGQDCDGLKRTLRALGLEVTYADGEIWSVDGFISVGETLTTFSQTTGPIDDPEVLYTNLTEINEFSMSDNQLTINLTQGRYQYDGTLRSGTGEWMGSGTVNYATGITETFSVDLLRKLLNSVQVDFSGQLDANRSDGTALFVAADNVDQSKVEYTITAEGESVQTTNTW